MAERDRDSWLYDLSLVLTPEIVDRYRRNDPSFEVFAGSRRRVFPWLALVSAVAAALGGGLASAALWSRWWAALSWIAVALALCFVVHLSTRRLFGPPITFLAGWCLFFGVLVGAFAMWGAQLHSSAWAYGIAGGLVFFLLGITGGLIEPPNSKPMEDWFLTSAVSAPISSCLAAWIYRNLLPDPTTLTAAAFTGLLAGLPFLCVTMALHLLAWRPNRGLLRLATLYLHNDDFVGQALPLLDKAICATPQDPRAFERRAFAHALTGNNTAAEADWVRAQQLDPSSNATALCQGWLALRQGQPGIAQQAFERAMAGRERDSAALQGVGVAHLRRGNASEALQALKRISSRKHGALSLTYLAEAWLAYGDAANAIGAATDAIEEMDSTHGRSWLVRAEAYVLQGKIETAAEDYNRAIWAADEPGIEDKAVAGLGAIDRPISEDEPE